MPELNRSEALKEQLEKLLARSRQIRAQADELEAEVARIKRLLGSAKSAELDDRGGEGAKK